MKRVIQVAVALAFAMPIAVSAQSSSDPDKKVADGGVKVAGWQARLDRPNQKVEDLKFVAMGPGFHVTSGPAAIYFNPANTGTGHYTVKASLTQTKAPAHREAYGIFLAGENVSADNQTYYYIVVAGTGEFTIKHRAGAETHTIVDWTANPAVKKADDAGKATNEVAVEVGDNVRFLINGTEVHKAARSALGAMNGQAGLRVNHNLDVHVGSFSVTKM
ncbi:MAG TPA: hypothetical protein VH762_12165 [Gemmatimonadaceae bacterium]|jgi:hypothetical protein